MLGQDWMAAADLIERIEAASAHLKELPIAAEPWPDGSASLPRVTTRDHESASELPRAHTHT
jgi:hypothetical protein